MIALRRYFVVDDDRRLRLLKALAIAERHGNQFMAANIRKALREYDGLPDLLSRTLDSECFTESFFS